MSFSFGNRLWRRHFRNYGAVPGVFDARGRLMGGWRPCCCVADTGRGECLGLRCSQSALAPITRGKSILLNRRISSVTAPRLFSPLVTIASGRSM